MGRARRKLAAVNAEGEGPAPVTPLPDAQTLADLLNIPLADLLSRLEALQTRNRGLPLSVEQVADLLRRQVTPQNLLALYTKGGQLLLEAWQTGRSEVRHDPAALA